MNKICILLCSVNFVGNKSLDYKTSGFGLLIKSCYVERRIPTLVGRARAMLIQADINTKEKGEL